MTLHLKDAESEFAEPFRIENVIRKYSDHIAFPVTLHGAEDDEPKVVNEATALWMRPRAEIDDGKLHACLIGDAPPLTRLKLFNMAERGRHVGSDRVEVLDDAGFRITFAEPPRFEMDGDVRRAQDVTLEVRAVPDALSVVAPRD